MIVGIDVDNTICRMMPSWLRACNEEYGEAYEESDMLHWDMSHNVRPGIEILKYLNRGDLLYGPDTKEEPGALGAVKRLVRHGHSIVYVSHNVDSGMHDAKVRWMRANGFMYYGELWSAVGSAPKTRLSIDAIIDDKPDTVREFIRAGRIGIIYTQSWNRGEQFPLRITDWNLFDGDLLNYVWQTLQQREADSVRRDTVLHAGNC